MADLDFASTPHPHSANLEQSPPGHPPIFSSLGNSDGGSPVPPPSVLRPLKAWLCWRYEGGGPSQKERKVPYYANGSRRRGVQGESQDLAHLVTYGEAKAAAERLSMTGVGLALLPGMGITALDFDNVVGPDGALPPEVELAITGTYAEISPSGRGVRAFLIGDLGNYKSARSLEHAYGFEVFSTSGFVTFTGDILPAAMVAGLADVVTPVGEAVRALCEARFRAANSNSAPRLEDSDDFMLGREPRPILSEEEIGAYLSDLDPSMGRDEWIRVGMALHHQTEGAGFDLWDEWSSGGHQYPGREDLFQQWRSFRTERLGRQQITFRSIIQMSNRARDALGLPRRSGGAGDVGHASPPAPLSEDALADEFTTRHHGSWRYVDAWGRWMRWTGKVWKPDSTKEARDLVRAVCRGAHRRAETRAERTRVSSAKTIASVEQIAMSDRRHAETTDAWDTDPWLLNTPGGIVDLKTGDLQPHDPSALMTKIAACSPGGDCPLWCQFLDKVTSGDVELQLYLQRMAGYCLTGITTEHALFFLYGTGANGKSVFANTLSEMMGDYAQVATVDMLMETKAERHSTDIASLSGSRLVIANETEEGRRWAESRIKSLTGGDRIKARFMRQDNFEFTPQFKLVVAGNHRPGIANVDEAMRRRLHMIPFTVTIPPQERDKDLQRKLRVEMNGILSWALEGVRAWQEQGLKPPPSVRAAIQDYFEEEDALGRWLGERCRLDPSGEETSADLYRDWANWAAENGERGGSQKAFSQNLKARGLEKMKSRSGHGFRGVVLDSPGSPETPAPKASG